MFREMGTFDRRTLEGEGKGGGASGEGAGEGEDEGAGEGEGAPAQGAGADAGKGGAADEGKGGKDGKGKGGAADEGKGGKDGKGEGGESDLSWLGSDEELTPEVRAYMETKSFKSPMDLFKSLRGAEKIIGGGSIEAPPDNPEKIGDWYKENIAPLIGVPEKADGYEVAAPEFDDAVKDFVHYTPENHTAFLEAAHKLAMSPAQVAGMMEVFKEQTEADAKAFASEALHDEAQMQSTMKAEWGDAAEQNLTAALEVGAEMGLDEAGIEALRLGKVAGSATLTKILFELAQVRGSDTLTGGGRNVAPESKAQAEEELQAFMSKNGKALNQADHPEHDWAVGELAKLKRRAGRGTEGMG